ncbi:MAG: flagellar brake domain-containing protein [Phycisphaerales bacterium JB039]
MPANRSRTLRWRDSLRKIQERGGSIEISIDLPEREGAGSHLIWRVRVVDVTSDRIVVEQPVALGRELALREGLEIVAAITVGQNRWMFRTRSIASGGGTLSVEMPTQVDRCQRRDFFRVGTAALALPPADCWPLLDPVSAVSAEVATRALIVEGGTYDPEAAILLPEVGPRFGARLVNIGGGGAGIVIRKEDASSLDRARLLWVRLDLTPQLAAPIGMAARVVHTHLDSAQNLYAGLAFDFGHHPGYRQFVVEQICRYVEDVSHRQTAPAEYRQAG